MRLWPRIAGLYGAQFVLLLSAVIPTWAMAPSPSAAIERLGTHIFLEIFDAPFATLNSSHAVTLALRAATTAGGLTVVGELTHSFPVQGVSALLLISESHLSIHAWPERGYAAVDLFTCGEAERLPCKAREPIHYGSNRAGWMCDGGMPVHEEEAQSGLWLAVQALLDALGAGGAMATWMERGLPAAARGYNPPAARAKPTSFGWLGGLEGDEQDGQRPEL